MIGPNEPLDSPEGFRDLSNGLVQLPGTPSQLARVQPEGLTFEGDH